MDESQGEPSGESTRPGPVYDTAMRGVIEGDPVAACRLLGIEVVGQPQTLTTSFPIVTLAADLLLRVGPARLAHVEYVRRATGDLVTRMLGYRWAISRDHPGDQLSQHIVVLGGGRVRGHDHPARTGFLLDLKILYLRELDPATLLASPSLAPLAALGRGSPSDRAEACTEALRLIGTSGGIRAEGLVRCTTVLATITLNTPTIWKIVEEVGMAVESIAELFRDTAFGQALVQQGREQGLERGMARGMEQGMEQGREQLLVALLEDRFGSHRVIPALARCLTGWADAGSAVHAITTAASLEELSSALSLA
jgi:hypothetical protein